MKPYLSPRGYTRDSVTVLEANVGLEDMVLLKDCRDVGIVENLKERLQASLIYTYIGPVLIVCNPYKWLDIYDEYHVNKYKFQTRSDTPPHIFMTAESAYRGMIIEEENQCVIICGESGAGKTEASKQIQSYIAAVCGGGQEVDAIKELFLRSNPVLEAFGNAKTLRNNNSSRFGKYFELKFDRYGSPKGGIITNYLLEKSRVVNPATGERGFHIFYQLLASSYGKSFGLSQPQDYDYLQCSQCKIVDGVDDAAEFENTLQAMYVVGMNDEKIKSIFALLAAILLLGNVHFVAMRENNAEGSECKDTAALLEFCNLIQIDAELMYFVLTHREVQTNAGFGRTETYQVPQAPAQATARRDSIAKSLYERLFDMIVQSINTILEPSDEIEESDMLSIGVLDIYGFEIFEKNGFEQLCINYVNEKLQQIFIELALRSEQEEYEREGITWLPIPFFNNRIVCELLDGAQPPGIFRILDDACKSLHGTQDPMEIDKKFSETAGKIYSRHVHYQATNRAFVIKHYAGDVLYTLGKLGELNKDGLHKDMILMLQTSKNEMIQQLFTEVVDINDKKSSNLTAGFRIRSSCNALVTSLMDCSPHYVRCIKSNDTRLPLHVDTKRVQHQVKYLGLSENIKVRRAGFAYRSEYSRFLDRFAVIQPKKFLDWKGSDKDGAIQLSQHISTELGGLPKEEIQFGRTMIFVRETETYYNIEQLREKKLNDYASKIQKTWTRFNHRRDFVSLQIAMTKLYQKNKKVRRRESILRPYLGDYLRDLDGPQWSNIKTNVVKIINYYDPEECIVFADTMCYQVVSSDVAPLWTYKKRLMILTDSAIYLMEIVTDTLRKQYPTKKLPDVILRRRIAVQDTTNMAVLDGLGITNLPDPIMIFFMKQNMSRMKEPYFNPTWPDKASGKKCVVTGKPFTMFEWKKRCKVTGQFAVDSACNYMQSIPDYGYYDKARVNDLSIGLVSTDISEDIILYCDKRTEFIGLLSIQWKRLNGTRPPISFSTFFELTPGVEPSLSQLPASELQFTALNSPIRKNIKLPLVSDDVNQEDLVGQLDKTTLNFMVSPGVEMDFAESRRIRQEEKRRNADILRMKIAEERKQRSEYRRLERERERILRIEEKKARKAAERAAKGITPIQKKDMTKPSIATQTATMIDGEKLTASRVMSIIPRAPPPPQQSQPLLSTSSTTTTTTTQKSSIHNSTSTELHRSRTNHLLSVDPNLFSMNGRGSVSEFPQSRPKSTNLSKESKEPNLYETAGDIVSPIRIAPKSANDSLSKEKDDDDDDEEENNEKKEKKSDDPPKFETPNFRSTPPDRPPPVPSPRAEENTAKTGTPSGVPDTPSTEGRKSVMKAKSPFLRGRSNSNAKQTPKPESTVEDTTTDINNSSNSSTTKVPEVEPEPVVSKPVIPRFSVRENNDPEESSMSKPADVATSNKVSIPSSPYHPAPSRPPPSPGMKKNEETTSLKISPRLSQEKSLNLAPNRQPPIPQVKAKEVIPLPPTKKQEPVSYDDEVKHTSDNEILISVKQSPIVTYQNTYSEPEIVKIESSHPEHIESLEKSQDLESPQDTKSKLGLSSAYVKTAITDLPPSFTLKSAKSRQTTTTTEVKTGSTESSPEKAAPWQKTPLRPTSIKNTHNTSTTTTTPVTPALTIDSKQSDDVTPQQSTPTPKKTWPPSKPVVNETVDQPRSFSSFKSTPPPPRPAVKATFMNTTASMDNVDDTEASISLKTSTNETLEDRNGNDQRQPIQSFKSPIPPRPPAPKIAVTIPTADAVNSKPVQSLPSPAVSVIPPPPKMIVSEDNIETTNTPIQTLKSPPPPPRSLTIQSSSTPSAASTTTTTTTTTIAPIPSLQSPTPPRPLARPSSIISSIPVVHSPVTGDPKIIISSTDKYNLADHDSDDDFDADEASSPTPIPIKAVTTSASVNMSASATPKPSLQQLRSTLIVPNTSSTTAPPPPPSIPKPPPPPPPRKSFTSASDTSLGLASNSNESTSTSQVSSPKSPVLKSSVEIQPELSDTSPKSKVVSPNNKSLSDVRKTLQSVETKAPPQSQTRPNSLIKPIVPPDVHVSEPSSPLSPISSTVAPSLISPMNNPVSPAVASYDTWSPKEIGPERVPAPRRAVPTQPDVLPSRTTPLRRPSMNSASSAKQPSVPSVDISSGPLHKSTPVTHVRSQWPPVKITTNTASDSTNVASTDETDNKNNMTTKNARAAFIKRVSITEKSTAGTPAKPESYAHNSWAFHQKTWNSRSSVRAEDSSSNPSVSEKSSEISSKPVISHPPPPSTISITTDSRAGVGSVNSSTSNAALSLSNRKLSISGPESASTPGPSSMSKPPPPARPSMKQPTITPATTTTTTTMVPVEPTSPINSVSTKTAPIVSSKTYTSPRSIDENMEDSPRTALSKIMHPKTGSGGLARAIATGNASALKNSDKRSPKPSPRQIGKKDNEDTNHNSESNKSGSANQDMMSKSDIYDSRNSISSIPEEPPRVPPPPPPSKVTSLLSHTSTTTSSNTTAPPNLSNSTKLSVVTPDPPSSKPVSKFGTSIQSHSTLSSHTPSKATTTTTTTSSSSTSNTPSWVKQSPLKPITAIATTTAPSMTTTSTAQQSTSASYHRPTNSSVVASSSPFMKPNPSSSSSTNNSSSNSSNVQSKENIAVSAPSPSQRQWPPPSNASGAGAGAGGVKNTTPSSNTTATTTMTTPSPFGPRKVTSSSFTTATTNTSNVSKLSIGSNYDSQPVNDNITTTTTTNESTSSSTTTIGGVSLASPGGSSTAYRPPSTLATPPRPMAARPWPPRPVPK